MDIRLGDILIMKKPHPCGNHRFSVHRIGMDFRIRCEKCQREVLVPRSKVEKNIKQVQRGDVMIDKAALLSEKHVREDLSEGK